VAATAAGWHLIRDNLFDRLRAGESGLRGASQRSCTGAGSRKEIHPGGNRRERTIDSFRAPGLPPGLQIKEGHKPIEILLMC
jgi:hypothetical protein